MSTGEGSLTTSSQLEGASLPCLPVDLPGDGDAPAESGISGVAAPQEPAPVQAPSKPAYSLPLSSGAKQPVTSHPAFRGRMCVQLTWGKHGS